MAFPKWITPRGNLGTVPELEYYQFPLDAYDESGGTLEYSVVSGRLPLGIQLTKTGTLKGIPLSEFGGDQNAEYQFSIRAKNTSTLKIADRTFSITVTNVFPPIIEPRNVDLGIVLDGSIIDLQLEAIENNPGAELSWSISSGVLPPGLSFSSDGKITGYLIPIPSNEPGTTIGWDNSAWSNLGWDFPLFTVSKVFTFVVEVTDGVNYDRSTYKITVFPRGQLSGDNEELTADTTVVTSDIAQTKHFPIITTKQSELFPVRQGSYFSFDFNAVDLDNDTLQYVTTTLFSGAFDEQNIVGNNIPYINTKLIGTDLYAGIYPRADVVETDGNSDTTENIIDFTSLNYQPGDVVKVVGANNFWYDTTITNDTVVRISGTRKVTGSPGQYLTQALSGANATINSVSDTTGSITIAGSTFLGILAIGGAGYKSKIMNLTGATITANIGDYITQASTGANARVTASVVNSSKVNVVVITPQDFVIGSGNIAKNGSSISAFPNSLDFISITANVGDYITQASTGANARVTASATNATTAIIRYVAGTFAVGNATTITGNIAINGQTVAAYPYGATRIGQAGSITANPGDTVLQPSTGATATVVTGGVDVNKLSVVYNSGVFNTVSGNLRVNSTDYTVYPGNVVASTDFDVTYNNGNQFIFNSTVSTANVLVSGTNTFSKPSKIISVGTSVIGLSTEGTTGFDEAKFDQGSLDLPPGLTFDINTGWLTGQLPTQTINEINYEFEVSVFKKDLPSYVSRNIYKLTVLGDLFNRIDWVTGSELGTIENGNVSDLSVVALSTKGKTLTYTLTKGQSNRLPQGLLHLPNGLLSGRVSFELFGIDRGKTTLDDNITTFDNTYEFTVTASDYEKTVSSDKTFTLSVIQRNDSPYENLYLRALPILEQRNQFRNIITDSSVFPSELIYRNEDQWFGVAKDIKSLFLPGLKPNTLSSYATAISTNHFKKRVTFGEVKTAKVKDSNFNTKYEVVYVELFDENSNSLLKGPKNIIDLTNEITPYYSKDGSEHTVAYPNSFANMESVMVQGVGYVNKGALPDWMTSKQDDGRILGFTRAVVLAYTIPGASELIAYRFKEKKYNLNEIDFTVDRYQLDKNYSENYSIPVDTVTFNNTISANVGDVLSQSISNTTAIVIEELVNGYTAKIQYINKGFTLYQLTDNNNTVYDLTSNILINNVDTSVYPLTISSDPVEGEFVRSRETTFDRYPNTSSLYVDAGTVNYALSVPFDEINRRTVDYVKNAGGLDGIKSFRNGDRIVFAQQEYKGTQGVLDNYNQGWNDVTTLWDSEKFDNDRDSIPTDDDLGWDASSYVTGYNENLLDPMVPNRRAGVWQVNIINNVIFLEFVQEIANYNKIFVRNGFTYSGATIYFDPIVKPGNLVPNYSIIAQEIKLISTRFDGNGTRFTNNRDKYSAPGIGDKYIKFTKTGVFN